MNEQWTHLVSGPQYQLAAVMGLLEASQIPVQLELLAQPVIPGDISSGYAGIAETTLASELLVPHAYIGPAMDLLRSLPDDQRPMLGDELPDETEYGAELTAERDLHEDEDAYRAASPLFSKRQHVAAGRLVLIGGAVVMLYLIAHAIGTAIQ